MVTKARLAGVSIEVLIQHATTAGRSVPAVGSMAMVSSLVVRTLFGMTGMAPRSRSMPGSLYRPSFYAAKITLFFPVDAVNDKFEVPDDYGWSDLAGEHEIVPF